MSHAAPTAAFLCSGRPDKALLAYADSVRLAS